MKITQALIDQAAIIANAKVGDTIEESFRGGKWYTPPSRVVLGDREVRYRIKPQPRVVYVNTYRDSHSDFIHNDLESAKEAARGFESLYASIAAPYQQIGEGEKP